jgi:hypothetical protein
MPTMPRDDDAEHRRSSARGGPQRARDLQHVARIQLVRVGAHLANAGTPREGPRVRVPLLGRGVARAEVAAPPPLRRALRLVAWAALAAIAGVAILIVAAAHALGG